MSNSTQDFLEISDIREGVVLLKSGDIRGVLSVSSINYSLKSSEEQNAITAAFQSFLNSLDFNCQIIIRSRNINITPYLDAVKALEDNQENELMRAQITSYSEFIKDLVAGDNVMTKTFYVIVPYSLTDALGARGLGKKMGGRGKLSDEDFAQCRDQLWQRMEFLALGLKRCGLEVTPLETPDLIELYWSTNHPAEAEVGYYPEIAPELLK